MLVIFIVWIAFIRLEQKTNLHHKKVRKNKDFCNVVIPSEDTKVLEFNQFHKSNKTPLIVYADRESLTEHIDGCKNNTKKLFRTKVGKHIPSGFLMLAMSSFKDIGKKVWCMQRLQRGYGHTDVTKILWIFKRA